MAVGRIEVVVFEGKVRHVSNVELRVSMVTRLSCRSGKRDLRLLHVDPVHLPGLYGIGEAYRDCPWSAAEIEYTVSWVQMR